MSQENVELARTAVEAFACGDLEGFLRVTAPDVRFEPRLAALEGVYNGHDGVREFFAEVRENVQVLDLHALDIRDLGDTVLAVGAFRIGGAVSGVNTEAPFAIVATFNEGRMTRVKDYGAAEDQALEDAARVHGP